MLGRNCLQVHASEGLDLLSSDEHGVELLLQHLVDGSSDKLHVRIGHLPSRERDAHGRVKVFVEVVLDRDTGWNVLATVDSQPNIDHLVFRRVRQRNTNRGLPQKSGENLESAGIWS